MHSSRKLINNPNNPTPSLRNLSAICPKAAQLFALLRDNPTINLRLIARAVQYAITYHKGQTRKSGEPFYYHPLEVAIILAPFTTDPNTLVVALLHDSVEDSPLSYSQIAFMFSTTIALLVDRVTKFKDSWRRHALEDYEVYYKLTHPPQADKRILQIKVADRIHNMRTIQYHASLTKQKRIAKETLRLFLPLAQNIGLPALVQELETLSLQTLHNANIQ